MKRRGLYLNASATNSPPSLRPTGSTLCPIPWEMCVFNLTPSRLSWLAASFKAARGDRIRRAVNQHNGRFGNLL